MKPNFSPFFELNGWRSRIAATAIGFLVFSGSPTWADTVIVESRLVSGDTNGFPPYLEMVGNWQDSMAKSTAPGLAGTGSRFATTDTASFKVMPTLAFAGGIYSVEVTQQGPTSQSTNILVSITQSNCAGLPATTAAFQRVNGNIWKSVGNIVLDPGQTTPEIAFSYLNGSTNRFYSDSVRFVHQEQVIIETRQADGTVNSNLYQELQGNWFNSTAKSSAPGVTGTGVTANNGSRAADTNSPSFRITPQLLTPGATYSLETSQNGPGSQSADIVASVSQSNCTGLPATTTAFQRAGANTWKKIGDFTLDPGQTNPVITFTYLSGTLGGANGRFYADSFRIVNAGDACLYGLPQLATVNGPLAAGQTFVNVPAVDGAAVKVTVYANDVQIGELTNGVVADINVVTTSPLVKGEQITATQTGTNGVESCRVANGPKVGGGANPRLRISLSIRQNTTLTGPIGANGGSTGALKMLGATHPVGSFGTAPIGGRVIYPSTCWQTVSFLRGPDPLQATDPSYSWFGGGAEPTNIFGDFGVLESIALCLDDLTDTGPYAIYIDNVMNDSTTVQNFETPADGTVNYFFSPPAASLTTKGYLVAQAPGNISPNISRVSSAYADTGTKSAFVSWQFLNTAPVNWLRLITTGSGNANPEVDLRLPISFRILVLPLGQTNAGSLTITSPTSRTNFAGETATFTTTATGTAPFAYQWALNGTNINGATGSSLVLNNVQSGSAGSYTVIVNNSSCSSTSAMASLTVLTPPSIETQPQSQTNQAGGNVTFSVVAAGSLPLTYQWRKNGVNISGATDSSLSLNNVQISNVQLASAGTYSVVVQNYTSVTSAVVILSVTNASALVVPWGSDEFGQATSPSATGLDLRGKLVAADSSRASSLSSSLVMETNLHALHLNLGNLKAVAIAAGDNHSLALRGDGTVVAWGRNNNHQVSPLPDAFTNHTATAIAADGAVSMALLNDGSVVVWGDDGFEQTNVPEGLTNVIAIAAGTYHNLVLKADGTIAGWGYNGDGQHSPPPGLTGVVALAAGTAHSLALKDNGTVVGFGANDFEQSNPPTNLTGVVSIAANGNHSLALKSDGTVVAWGENTYGESTAPADLANVVGIAAGQNHSLALLADGTVVGWGVDTSGQRTPPAGLTGVTAIAGGNNHSVALSSSSLVVTVPPQSQTVPAGLSASFLVKAVSDGPVSYQWQNNGSEIAGATSSTLALNNVQLSDEGDYSVIVSNSNASLTNTATLQVCTCSISPSIAYFGTNGGSSNIVISAQAGYPWGVTNLNPDWITITSGATYSGNGSVDYTVAPLPNATPRIGTLIVAGRTFLVSQARRETAKPTVTITYPTGNPTVTDPSILFIGKASDKSGLVLVAYQLENTDGISAYLPALGTTNWSAPVTLTPGTNIFRVVSFDTVGNRSAVASRTLFYAVHSMLTVQTNGPGSIVPNRNGQSLLIGRGYTLTAVPRAGQVFSNWTGSVSSDKAVLNFLMRSNMSLTANFVTNPFIPTRGVYNGLFFDETNGVTHQSSGFFTFTLATNGTFSGSMLINGGQPSFSGKFNVAGQTSIRIPRAGKPALTNYLALDTTGNASDEVHGTVTDGSWVAALSGDRAYRWTTTNVFAQFGKYTMSLPGSDSGVTPIGDGFGLVNISRQGAITLTGALADGRDFFQTVSISKNGMWPLYVPLYGGRGSILSWLTLTNTGSSSFTGNLSWIRPTIPTSRYYRNGFTNGLFVVGSSYQPPTNGTAALSFTNGTVVLSGGNLSASLTNSLSLNSNNVVVITNSTNRLHLRLTRATGAVNGDFVHPVTKLTVPIRGVLLQQQSSAMGFFLGTNESGRARLETK